MRLKIDWSEELSDEEIEKLFEALDDTDELKNPETIAKALLFISDVLDEAELGRIRLGCKGAGEQLNIIIKGGDPRAQAELLADLAEAIERAHELSTTYGGIDLDTVPLGSYEFGTYTVGDLLRSGIVPLLRNEPEKCKVLDGLVAQLRAFSEEVAQLNRPYFPDIESNTINPAKLNRALKTAFQILSLINEPLYG